MSESCFRLLPEWHPQRAILINWPHRYCHRWDPVRDHVNGLYIELVKAVAMTQSVMIICLDIEQRNQIQRALVEGNVNLPRVRFFIIPSDDIWMRDYGPLVLRCQDQTKIVNFQFNGRGNKYSADRDNMVTAELFDQNFFLQAQFSAVNLVMEGSNIETDGLGTLLTTQNSSSSRNPDYSQDQIETLLKQHLGMERIIWLDADRPIDALVRFVDAETICYQQSPEFGALEAQLKNLKNPQGRPYRLAPLPMPQSIQSFIDSRPLPASYTQFLITNRLVLMPSYEDPSDLIAKTVLESCFPNRVVMSIPCRSLLENDGSLHTVTLQIPV